MNALTELKGFVQAKLADFQPEDIREYAIAQSEGLAEVFGVTRERFLSAIAAIDDDRKLGEALMRQIKHHSAKKREARAREKQEAAQCSADSVAALASWQGDRLCLDVAALLASLVSSRGAQLVFRSDGFEVAVPMAPLKGLAKLRKPDLTGFVDREGLHLRWNAGKGGLNLRSCRLSTDVPRVVLDLLPRPASIAA